jgi:hypothetical protein
MRVSFTPERSLRVESAIDQRLESTVLQSNQEKSWTIQQVGCLHVPGFGTLRIQRSEMDAGLEESQRRLGQLDAWYARTLQAFQANPADPHALDELSRRRYQCDQIQAEQQRMDDALQELIPQGLTQLQAQIYQLAQTQQAYLFRHPDWSDWVNHSPRPEELEQQRQALFHSLAQTEQAISAARSVSANREKALRQAELAGNDLAKQLALAEGQARTLSDHLMRGQDSLALAQQWAAAEVDLAERQRELESATLATSDRDVEQRFQAAKTRLKECSERLQENEINLHGLSIRQHGSEGLHQRRMVAEQLCSELTVALEREQQLAEAHRHLHDLFEEIRQEQVQRTVEPVSRRVLGWVDRLGLEEYRDLHFVDRVIPDNLVLRSASVGEEQVGLDTESYGTQEQLSLLIRLALGGLLSRDGTMVALLDDPLTHTDREKHRRILQIVAEAARGETGTGNHSPLAAGPLQILILTCHPEHFKTLEDAHWIDMTEQLVRSDSASLVEAG